MIQQQRWYDNDDMTTYEDMTTRSNNDLVNGNNEGHKYTTIMLIRQQCITRIRWVDWWKDNDDMTTMILQQCKWGYDGVDWWYNSDDVTTMWIRQQQYDGG